MSDRTKIKCPEKTNPAGHGSKTMTITSSEETDKTEKINLTAKDTNKDGKTENSRRVTWTEETVDNEHMGKKSSKVCCIYKKKHALFGESSSESDSSDDDVSPLERKPKAMKRKMQNKKCNHDHVNDEPSTSKNDS